MHLVQKPTISLRRAIFIWIITAISLAFLSHAFIISPSSQSQRYHSVHFRYLEKTNTFGVTLKYNGKSRHGNMMLNHSSDRRGDHSTNKKRTITSKKRSAIRRIRYFRFHKRIDNEHRNTTSFALISIAGFLCVFSTGNVQRIAVSIISYTTAKYTYDLFEKLYATRDGDENRRGRGRKPLKGRFQKKYYKRDKERGPGDCTDTGISSSKTAISMKDGTSKRMPMGTTTRGSEQQTPLNSNPNGKAWLKQSMDNLEETDRMISDLKRQEAEARAAEQKAKAREWVNETLRATTDAKNRADVMRRQEEEARHKAQKWAESVARQSGVDLN